jgi:hypothetical protein
MAETVGSLVDKISIAELKIYHMAEQAARPDASDEMRERCQARLAVLREQRDDLARELSRLVSDVLAGRVTLKVYRQFKMYNDPQYRTGVTPAAPNR